MKTRGQTDKQLYTLLHDAEIDSHELVPDSRSLFLVPCHLLAPTATAQSQRQSCHYVKGEILSFSGELRMPSSLLLLYTAISWIAVLRQCSHQTMHIRCLPGLLSFAALRICLGLHIAILASNNKVLISVFYAHIMCTSVRESSVLLELLHHLSGSSILHRNKIPLKSPEVWAF